MYIFRFILFSKLSKVLLNFIIMTLPSTNPGPAGSRAVTLSTFLPLALAKVLPALPIKCAPRLCPTIWTCGGLLASVRFARAATQWPTYLTNHMFENRKSGRLNKYINRINYRKAQIDLSINGNADKYVINGLK